MISRRTWLARTGGVALLALAGRRADAAALLAKPSIVVYKDPGCGCCNAWVDHLRASGFDVQAHNVSDMDERKGLMGVPAALRSCHTAQTGAYVIEGHVPAADIKRLLAEHPKAAGLAVPGMVMGTEGMEHGDHSMPYEVILFDRAGKTKVFAVH